MVEAAAAKITVDELARRFGPAAHVAPYGDCLIVDGTKFDPDWEAELADQGYRVYYGMAAGRAVTMVKLSKAVPEGKVVYVPPAPSALAKKDPPAAASTASPQKKKYVLKGPTWTPQEQAELLQCYDKLVAEFGTYGMGCKKGKLNLIAWMFLEGWKS